MFCLFSWTLSYTKRKLINIAGRFQFSYNFQRRSERLWSTRDSLCRLW